MSNNTIKPTSNFSDNLKVSQIWKNKTTKMQIRILEIANKIIVAEVMPNKMPVFLTSIDLEENYEMVKVQAHHN